MILEAIRYLRNPGSRFARKLGYSKELVAIESRYSRIEKHWHSHQQQSKTMMLQAVDSCNHYTQVIIIGAGLLRDIPLTDIANKFKQVVLIDVIFSRKTRSICQQYRNVNCVEHDINGLAGQLLGNKNWHSNQRFEAELPATISQPDLVISANVLSQLHHPPIAYLDKKFDLPEDELFRLAQTIITNHLNLLASQKHSCLVTDYCRINSFPNKESETEHALVGVELPEPNQKWYWDLEPEGEIAPGCATKTLVYGYSHFTQTYSPVCNKDNSQRNRLILDA